MTDVIEYYRDSEYKYNIPYYSPSFMILVIQYILITLDGDLDDKKKEITRKMIDKIFEENVLQESLLVRERLGGDYSYNYDVLIELVKVMQEKYHIRLQHTHVLDEIPPFLRKEKEVKDKVMALLWNYCPMFKDTGDGNLQLRIREKL